VVFLDELSLAGPGFDGAAFNAGYRLRRRAG
jgi:hypothetical protein